MVKYKISDGNAIGQYDSWDDLMANLESWYDYLGLPEYGAMDVPDPDFSDVGEGDIDYLNDQISIWEEEVALAAGFEVFQGHGNHTVSAASEMGLRLEVSIVFDFSSEKSKVLANSSNLQN